MALGAGWDTKRILDKQITAQLFLLKVASEMDFLGSIFISSSEDTIVNRFSLRTSYLFHKITCRH